MHTVSNVYCVSSITLHVIFICDADRAYELDTCGLWLLL
jgi:hypothetical protein